jgi:hypothetical protein
MMTKQFANMVSAGEIWGKPSLRHRCLEHPVFTETGHSFSHASPLSYI